MHGQTASWGGGKKHRDPILFPCFTTPALCSTVVCACRRCHDAPRARPELLFQVHGAQAGVLVDVPASHLRSNTAMIQDVKQERACDEECHGSDAESTSQQSRAELNITAALAGSCSSSLSRSAISSDQSTAVHSSSLSFSCHIDLPAATQPSASPSVIVESPHRPLYHALRR